MTPSSADSSGPAYSTGPGGYQRELRTLLDYVLKSCEKHGVGELASRKIADFLLIRYGGTNNAERPPGPVPPHARPSSRSMHTCIHTPFSREPEGGQDLFPPRSSAMSIVLTPFARTRLFPRDHRRSAIQDCSAEEFEQRLSDEVPQVVLPGYAPFCLLHVHRNWTSTRCTAVPITDANRASLRSAYEARSTDELPVLVRWFEGIDPPVASYLLPILYSRDQLAKEGSPIDADWGVVGCLYTSEPEEIPMLPITMLRNALGVAEGGSGVPLDRQVYRHSVAFWEAHANWRG